MKRRIKDLSPESLVVLPVMVAWALLLGGCATHNSPLSATESGSGVRDERPVIGLQHDGPIRVVFQISADEWKDGVGKGLLQLRNLHQAYTDVGVEGDRLQIHAVFHGTAAEHLLTDSAWNRWHEESDGNPNAELVGELARRGVAVELCDTRRVANGWSKADIHPDVVLVRDAYERISDLQFQGFAYIRF